MDFSAAYVDHATCRNQDRRIEFRTGDACTIPYPDRSFDRVLSQLMLHFVPQAERAVAEMCRVARPGAVVAAVVWDARGGFVSNRVFWDTAAVLDPRADERRALNYTRPMSRPGELAAAWREAGFGDVRDPMLIMRMEFASFDNFWAPYLGKQGPSADYVGSLNAEALGRLQGAVRRAYLDAEPDGRRSHAAIAWAVRGTKPT